MTAIFTQPRDRVVDSNGRTVPGARLYFYNAGSLTPKAVYQNSLLTTPHPAPSGYVACDSGGLMPLIYLSGTYKVQIKTSDDVLIYEADNQDATLTTSSGVLPITSGGTGAGTAPSALSALGAAAQSALDALASTVGTIVTTISGYPAFGAIAGRNKLLATDLDSSEFAPVCIQRAVVTSSTRQALSGLIPLDNTTPLRSEGDTLFSTSFTPKKATSVMRINVKAFLAPNGASRPFALALFAPGISPSDTAIASNSHDVYSNLVPTMVELWHEFVAGQTTAMTIQVNSGSNGAYVFNGLPASGIFNGTLVSRVIIEEWFQP